MDDIQAANENKNAKRSLGIEEGTLNVIRNIIEKEFENDNAIVKKAIEAPAKKQRYKITVKNLGNEGNGDNKEIEKGRVKQTVTKSKHKSTIRRISPKSHQVIISKVKNTVSTLHEKGKEHLQEVYNETTQSRHEEEIHHKPDEKPKFQSEDYESQEYVVITPKTESASSVRDKNVEYIGLIQVKKSQPKRLEEGLPTWGFGTDKKPGPISVHSKHNAQTRTLGFHLDKGISLNKHGASYKENISVDLPNLQSLGKALGKVSGKLEASGHAQLPSTSAVEVGGNARLPIVSAMEGGGNVILPAVTRFEVGGGAHLTTIPKARNLKPLGKNDIVSHVFILPNGKIQVPLDEHSQNIKRQRTKGFEASEDHTHVFILPGYNNNHIINEPEILQEIKPENEDLDYGDLVVLPQSDIDSNIDGWLKGTISSQNILNLFGRTDNTKSDKKEVQRLNLDLGEIDPVLLTPLLPGELSSASDDSSTEKKKLKNAVERSSNNSENNNEEDSKVTKLDEHKDADNKDADSKDADNKDADNKDDTKNETKSTDANDTNTDQPNNDDNKVQLRQGAEIYNNNNNNNNLENGYSQIYNNNNNNNNFNNDDYGGTRIMNNNNNNNNNLREGLYENEKGLRQGAAPNNNNNNNYNHGNGNSQIYNNNNNNNNLREGLQKNNKELRHGAEIHNNNNNNNNMDGNGHNKIYNNNNNNNNLNYLREGLHYIMIHYANMTEQNDGNNIQDNENSKEHDEDENKMELRQGVEIHNNNNNNNNMDGNGNSQIYNNNNNNNNFNGGYSNSLAYNNNNNNNNLRESVYENDKELRQGFEFKIPEIRDATNDNGQQQSLNLNDMQDIQEPGLLINDFPKDTPQK
ncbi:probable cyclin-dependent serine/threonine-protein kinase DDB_G0292550 [Hyposmocoma kahamanoa]|uniref:probable cyclin-dependent serine/threonine-protein kinase DDB_G0292550 n=1 Tax=Hyposmocoma kahamanoa TaxID=1477025 RepID=UPI000E6D6B84|nr:probable cyclin-dependent serine/threonine-protein kinase DDB_G0292550 [Hyposmocoma kahamanoa]